MEFHLFLPQMRMTFDQLVERARGAEAAGFIGMAGMDHLAAPQAEDQPMYEAMVTNTWLAAHTERLTVASLVLCDPFRHPCQLAKEAVSLDHASGGRFELGIGWGSVASELDIYGVTPVAASARVGRLRETLEILRSLWAGETIDHEGESFTLRGAAQSPLPLGHIPLVVGGAGPKTLELVREFADWWNIHVGILDRFEAAREQVGSARISMQHLVAFVPTEDRREEIVSRAAKRFGRSRLAAGTGPELVEHFGRLGEQGVERVYAWFCDFAPVETLAAFGDEVIAKLA
jgi:alkanesulfonate monooxygenase SsuD/methylene tetrahydromethanopterin reductase-like flavin-dependent oxidoreductase (luciferase family)